NFLRRRSVRDPKHCVKISWIPVRHENLHSPLVHGFLRCGIRMDRYTNHRRTQHASVKNIARLEYLKNGAVFVLRRFRAVHGLMEVRVKGLADRVNALDAEPGNVVEKLLVDELKALAIVFVFGFAMRGEGVLETVDNGDEALDHARSGPLGIL